MRDGSRAATEHAIPEVGGRGRRKASVKTGAGRRMPSTPTGAGVKAVGCQVAAEPYTYPEGLDSLRAEPNACVGRTRVSSANPHSQTGQVNTAQAHISLKTGQGDSEAAFLLPPRLMRSSSSSVHSCMRLLPVDPATATGYHFCDAATITDVVGTGIGSSGCTMSSRRIVVR